MNLKECTRFRNVYITCYSIRFVLFPIHDYCFELNRTATSGYKIVDGGGHAIDRNGDSPIIDDFVSYTFRDLHGVCLDLHKASIKLPSLALKPRGEITSLQSVF